MRVAPLEGVGLHLKVFLKQSTHGAAAAAEPWQQRLGS